jgi:hypothetical protein
MKLSLTLEIKFPLLPGTSDRTLYEPAHPFNVVADSEILFTLHWSRTSTSPEQDHFRVTALTTAWVILLRD